MSRTRSSLYRWARLLGDIEAAEKGPGAYVKRRARRSIYRRTNSATRKLTRWLGL